MRGYNNKILYMSEDEAAQWADSWGLPDEVATAILEMAEDESHANDIWRDPTVDQFEAICIRAQELARQLDTVESIQRWTDYYRKLNDCLFGNMFIAEKEL